MLDWSTLKHAYGNAADIPPLIAQITPGPEATAWQELWSRLCHQGTVYSASFAALPALLEAAEQWNPRDRAQVLALASSILASDDVYGGRRDELVQPVAWVRQRFQQACREALAETRLPRNDFIYLLQSARSFEGDPFWGQELDHLVSGEFPGLCPNCGIDLYLVIGEFGVFTTAEDWAARSDKPGMVRVRDGVRRTAIQANQGVLPEPGEWLLDRAQGARQIQVAQWIRYIFGSSECPACNQPFQVIDAFVGNKDRRTIAAAGAAGRRNSVLTRQKYERRDDPQFGQKAIVAVVVASLPVWGGLGIAFALDWRPAGYLVSLACSLPIALLIVYFSLRVAKCPNCGRSVRVNWRRGEFRRGGMLRYVCEDCRIEWATHLYPGSDV